MAHYNRIARELAERPEEYAPILGVDADSGEKLGSRGLAASSEPCGCVGPCGGGLPEAMTGKRRRR